MPVSYLRPWQERPGVGGHIRVLDKTTGLEIVPSPKPEKMFRKKGLYDFSGSPLGETPAWLLERMIFAEIMEPGFAKVIRETFLVENWPVLGQMRFMALYCLKLYYRSPKFGRVISEATETDPEASEAEKALFRHTAARTASLILDGNARIVNQLAFRFFEASGTHRFITSDVPCWMWLVVGNAVVPMTRILDVDKGIRDGTLRQTRWLCALTPKYALEMCYCHAGPRRLGKVRLDNHGVEQLNNLLAIQADRFVVLPQDAS